MPRKTLEETMNQKETHESYGLLRFSRATTRNASLFGSNITHDTLISLTISEAEVRRDYQKNWYMDKKQLITIDMSASQFSEAITSMNIGEGVPVTIKRFNGEMRKEPPNPDFKKKARSELKKEMGILAERIDELSNDAKEILSQKGNIKKADKEKILKDLQFLTQEIRSNIPFAHECFQGAVEETVTEAKAEVDATLMNMRNQIGDKTLKSGINVPMLEEGSKDITVDDYEFCPSCKGRFSIHKPQDGKCPFCGHKLDVD